MDAPLGTDTDGNVACLLEVHKSSVNRRRTLLGIPGYAWNGGGRRSRWTRRWLALLGTASDRDVAKQLGLTTSSVCLKRQSLGIPSFHPRRAGASWAKAVLRMLGHRPDTEVATRLGVGAYAVQCKREELGIPAYRSARAVARTSKLRALLRLPNRMLREKHALSASVIHKLRSEYGISAPGRHPKRWTDEAVSRLGKESDTAIARSLGITPAAVHTKRHSLGIARFERHRRWTAAECRMLGRMSDAEVARRLGLAAPTVGAKRWSLGRARFRPTAGVRRSPAPSRA